MYGVPIGTSHSGILGAIFPFGTQSIANIARSELTSVHTTFVAYHSVLIICGIFVTHVWTFQSTIVSELMISKAVGKQ